MGKRARHEPGSFAWVDLRTDDPVGARRFYAELFGWQFTDWSAGSDLYIVASLEDDAVAGFKPLSEEQRAGSVSPFWLSYVAVADADAATARARDLGATVRREPFDITGARVSVIADPGGAQLCLRASPDGTGACRVDDPGSLAWHELTTEDAEAAIRFYAEFLDRHIEPCEVSGRPARWTPYFAVAALDDALARASSAGGWLLDGPREVRDARAATLSDPQGAEFGVLEARR
jgi:predicted enzyme related to lactoylglutathione lyase